MDGKVPRDDLQPTMDDFRLATPLTRFIFRIDVSFSVNDNELSSCLSSVHKLLSVAVTLCAVLPGFFFSENEALALLCSECWLEDRRIVDELVE
mmetsp:Transcript_21381/g.35378  ORF Transcript_21381/g.35378 Transcript_21381/m.35378 type:complete len:94 (+) Transcript_21381:273-554(+)